MHCPMINSNNLNELNNDYYISIILGLQYILYNTIHSLVLMRLIV